MITTGTIYLQSLILYLCLYPGISCPGNESPDSRYAAGKSLMEQYKDGSKCVRVYVQVVCEAVFVKLWYLKYKN